MGHGDVPDDMNTSGWGMVMFRMTRICRGEVGHGDVPDDVNTSGWVGAFYTDEAKTWNTVARSLKIKSNVISYQCSHQKTVFAIDMKRKPRGLSKKRGSENRSSLAQSQAVPSKKTNQKKSKESLQRTERSRRED